MACSCGIATSSSVLVSLRTAFERASEVIRDPIDFAFVFLSGDAVADKGDDILSLWQDLAPGVPVFGGSAESLVGRRTELECQCAASVLLVSGFKELPRIYELECLRTPDGPAVMGVSEEMIADSHRGLLTIACPISFSVELLADVLEYERFNPHESVIPIVGGYCSSSNWQSPNLLLAGDKALQRGGIAMTLPEGWYWHTVISQGCRPVGEPFVITAMEGQTVVELGGKPAMNQLRDMYATLPQHEQQMMSNSLMMGRAISEHGTTFSHGEFLIRAVQGVDSNNQGLVVTDRFQVGQTVRFHVRDAAAADADLQHLLSKPAIRMLSPSSALVFTCNGRGTRMFPEANHDAMALDTFFPDLPTAGMFAAGEFGPMANQNLVHGFTAIINLLIKR